MGGQAQQRKKEEKIKWDREDKRLASQSINLSIYIKKKTNLQMLFNQDKQLQTQGDGNRSRSRNSV